MPSKRRRWIVVLSIVLVFSILIAAIIVASGGSDTVSVTVEKVHRRTITQAVSTTGIIRPETEVKLSSEASGEIATLMVREGDSVRRGQLLLRIKPDIAETQLEQFAAAAEAAKMNMEAAKAEWERSRAEFQRITELYRRGFAAQQELEQSRALHDQALSRYNAATAEYERARAAHRQAQLQLARTALYAPISGIVTALSVETGEKVVGTAQMQGTELLRIADLSRMIAVVDVNENDVTVVKLGDTADITVDAIPEKTFRGIVTEIAHSPKVGRLGTQDEVVNFEVKILLLDTDPRLRPGMSCNAEIRTETRHNVLAVPLQSVTVRVEEGDTILPTARRRPPTVVFIHENGRARMVQVETGISDRNYIEIRKGLTEGTEVISGSFHVITRVLRDGTPVFVSPGTRKEQKPAPPGASR
ncbi:MAG: efflux RND transporter periplasmic adaptor subunit [Candidatus Kapabacteria bacterium]|nr:efflux RND transporter periplasmic adaptor subunit [Candidatus Kapabacteria bacterium]MCS7169459.1 efflux RND transporter periplasmic adaptor subunit [Candidatus Kapabacteria bacterium]MDW7996311.1 efflux RND transporter periplasmic adaptor subunit [Bacteroidota bacterium]MDW8225070.1 efflux RND transporter periplasmic adaptor subunit [Bacteroidota bacterium]